MGLPKSNKPVSEAAAAAAEIEENAEAAARQSEEAEKAEKDRLEAEEAESKRLAKEKEAERAAATKAAVAGKSKEEAAAIMVANAKHPDARLKTTKHDTIKCPHTGVTVTRSGTSKKVPVSNWMKCQIEAGLLEVITD